MRFGFGWNSTGAVWSWRTIHATFTTAMDLRAFPFDTQVLGIQLEVMQVCLSHPPIQYDTEDILIHVLSLLLVLQYLAICLDNIDNICVLALWFGTINNYRRLS